MLVTKKNNWVFNKLLLVLIIGILHSLHAKEFLRSYLIQ